MLAAVLRPINPFLPCPENSILILSAFINLDQNAARKAWAEECVRKASEIANGITRSQQVLSVWKHKRVTNRYKS
jgi:hypothetical protein